MIPAIGYAIREQNRPILDDPAIDAAEINFERANDPLSVERYTGDMEFDYVSVHAFKLSVAGTEPPGREYLDALKSIASENGARSISDHLGCARGGHRRVDLGQFAPPPYTQPALEATCRNVDFVQRSLGETRFYLENIAYLFRRAGTMSEAEFLSSVLRKTGCGWLLDVTNVYANALNYGFDPYEFVEEVMPATENVQMHLAGGYFDDKLEKYIDSHSHPIPKPVFELYEFALEVARDKVAAVFIERDQNFPDEAAWRKEVQTVREIAESAAALA
jgi:uncharacterized protein (UPF0276 family)